MANQTNAPITVDTADDVKWDDEADVVVVGFGGAGAVASIQARELNAAVIAIDRFDGGGATAYSGGVVYAGGTKYQRASGYEDTPEEMYKYLDAEKNAVDAETLMTYCRGSNEDIEWLDRQGVPHGGNAFEEKTAFPPNDYFLYYSGNEKMPAFASIAKPAPRGHRTGVNGFGGHVLYKKLRESALAKGVKLVPHSPVTRLVVDASGAVVGVEVNAIPESQWKQHQVLYKKVHPWMPLIGERIERAIADVKVLEGASTQRRLIRARNGVLLSTGGFNHNREMTTHYRPVLAKVYTVLARLGSMGDDGSGMRLGESVGGVLDRMQSVCVARTLVPPNCYANGWVVNKHGKRFVNEAGYGFNVGGAIADQPDLKAWLILDAPTFKHGVWKSWFPGGNFMIWGLPALINIYFGGTQKASTLEALARKINVDPAGMAQQIAEANEMAKAGRPDPLGKIQELVNPVEKGPFYAVNLSLDNKYAAAQTMTVGGLRLDQRTGNVVRADGSVIKGLYSAGRTAIGICSGGFISGLSLADCVFSGRRAARSMVAQSSQDAAISNVRAA